MEREEERIARQRTERIFEPPILNSKNGKLRAKKAQEELQNAEKELKLLLSMDKKTGKNSQTEQKLAEAKSRLAGLQTRKDFED